MIIWGRKNMSHTNMERDSKQYGNTMVHGSYWSEKDVGERPGGREVKRIQMREERML